MFKNFIIVKYNNGETDCVNFDNAFAYNSFLESVTNWYLKSKIADFSTNGLWASELPDFY